MSPRGGGGSGPRIGTVYRNNEDGGDLEVIGTQVTGSPKGGAVIWGANPNIASTSTKLKKGQLIIIPGNPPPVKLTDKDPDMMTILIDGIEVPMTSSRILRTMDTCSDGWTGSTPWTPGADPAFDRATRPYSYVRSAAYIGNELMVGGRLYTVEPEMTDNGLVKGFHGYSFTEYPINT